MRNVSIVNLKRIRDDVYKIECMASTLVKELDTVIDSAGIDYVD